MVYFFGAILLIAIVFTFAMCKAAGRADRWEEEMEISSELLKDK